MKIHPEVANAIARGDAVVALESTIISHGMPYPQNVETARDVETVVRKNGAVPATIAILGGVVHVGLGDAELEKLGKLGHAVTKVSRRDLSVVIGRNGDGATTVSATMMIAARAGIKVFVTGGVGGVHRGGESSMDISADLTELGRTAMCVVCAGVKSILDIGRTLEYLETQGVTVLAYQTDEFPSFFTRTSGFQVQKGHNMQTPQSVGQVMAANRDYRIGSGMLLAVPVPAEYDAGPAVQRAVEQALKEADDQGIAGAKVTPFLLERVAAISGGDSLESNIALVKHNAEVGAKVAVAYAAELLQHRHGLTSQGPQAPHPTVDGKYVIRAESPPDGDESMAMVVGGIGVDAIARPSQGMQLVMESSTPGQVEMSVGGVGGNIARALACLGSPPLLVSAVGHDSAGELIRKTCREHDMPAGGLVPCAKSATYHAILNERGDLTAAIADMEVFGEVTPSVLQGFKARIAAASFIVCDGNIPAASLATVAQMAHQAGVPVWFEPTSVAKSVRILQGVALSQCTVISPNRDEVLAMAWALRQKKATEGSPDDHASGLTGGLLSLIGRAAKIMVEEAQDGNYAERRDIINAPVSTAASQYPPAPPEAKLEKNNAELGHYAPGKHGLREVSGWSGWSGTSQSKTEVVNATLELLDAGVSHVVVTLGPDGVLLGSRIENLPGKPGNVRMKHIPAIPIHEVVNVTGAGDCLTAGTVFALLRSPHIADKWQEAKAKGENRMASDALERAIWEGGLVCARHAVMNAEAVPPSLRTCVEATESPPDRA